jgi:hypothetical protein
MFTSINRPKGAKESLSRHLMRLSKQLLELISVVEEASKNFILISRTKQAKNLKTIRACKENTELILQAFKKYSSGDIIPLKYA